MIDFPDKVCKCLVAVVETRGSYLETDPGPIAMVIRVELFIHKPCRQKTALTQSSMIINNAVPIGISLAGLVNE